MATRSVIATVTDQGTVKGVYCHWDGNIEHNGRILVDNYTTEEKVEALISNGSISSLDETVGYKHSFDERPEGQTTFYHRDRGDALVIHEWDSVNKMTEDMYDCEFFYLFVANEDWYVAKGNDKFRLVSSILNKEVY